MRVEYTGRHTEIAPAVREMADRKLGKLSRVLRGITDVHVILTADDARSTAEVTVHSKNLDLAATEEGHDPATVVSDVIDKLLRQAKRHTGKIKERKRRGPSRPTAVWEGVMRPTPPTEDGAPRVIRTRRFVAKPMTVEEAVLEVGAAPDGFLVFRDAATEKVNVLYRRPDGNLGLIEPEA
jgi:putative sigma-54 modulation protein